MVFETILYASSSTPAPLQSTRAELASHGRLYGREVDDRRELGGPTYTFRPMHLEKNLAQLGDRLNRAREDLRILEEQLLFQMDVVEEAKTRMLVSETPLADREYRIARDDHERLLRQRDECQAEIADLKLEQDRLLDRMLGSKA